MVKEFPSSIGGSVVEFSPATRVARVRFPAGAVLMLLSSLSNLLIVLVTFFTDLNSMLKQFLASIGGSLVVLMLLSSLSNLLIVLVTFVTDLNRILKQFPACICGSVVVLVLLSNLNWQWS